MSSEIEHTEDTDLEAPVANGANIPSTVATFRQLPAQARPIVLNMCNAAMNSQLSALKKTMGAYSETLIKHSAQMYATSLAGYICGMPWHCIKTKEELSAALTQLTQAPKGHMALGRYMSSLKPVNVFIQAEPKESAAAYTERSIKALKDIRFEYVLIDASVFDAHNDTARLEFASKLGVMGCYVSVVEASDAHKNSLMQQNAQVIKVQEALKKVEPEKPSLPVIERLERLKQVNAVRRPLFASRVG